MNHRDHRRRKYLVDPKFQYWLIGRVMILAVMIIVVSLLILATVYNMYSGITVELIQPAPFDASSEMRSVITGGQSLFSLLWPVLSVCVLGTLFVTFIFGIVISHRMAGPVYSMQRTLTRLADGDLSIQTELRKKDAFKPMNDTINHLGKQWLKSILELQSLCRELDSGTLDDKQRQHVNRFGEVMKAFKTE